MHLDQEVSCIYGPIAVALPNGGLEIVEIENNHLYELWTDLYPYHWGNNGQWEALVAQITIKKKKIGLALGGGAAAKGDFPLPYRDRPKKELHKRTC